MKLADIGNLTVQQIIGAITAVVGALLAFLLVQEANGTNVNDTLMIVLGALSAMLGALNTFFGGTVNMARTVLKKRGDVRLTTAAKR